jgi:hypothetical protein
MPPPPRSATSIHAVRTRPRLPVALKRPSVELPCRPQYLVRGGALSNRSTSYPPQRLTGRYYGDGKSDPWGLQLSHERSQSFQYTHGRNPSWERTQSRSPGEVSEIAARFGSGSHTTRIPHRAHPHAVDRPPAQGEISDASFGSQPMSPRSGLSLVSTGPEIPVTSPVALIRSFARIWVGFVFTTGQAAVSSGTSRGNGGTDQPSMAYCCTVPSLNLAITKVIRADCGQVSTRLSYGSACHIANHLWGHLRSCRPAQFSDGTDRIFYKFAKIGIRELVDFIRQRGMAGFPA